MNQTKKFFIRNAEPTDHERIIDVIPRWWGGRDLRSSVPKLLLIHFGNTSFVAEKDGDLAGFLIGFLSQTRPDEGYLHFAGVHPDFRESGLGRTLYRKFYDVCLDNNRTIVRACTSPVNKLSIRFHLKMGFSIEPGNLMVDGVAVTESYLHKNDQKVLFKKEIRS